MRWWLALLVMLLWLPSAWAAPRIVDIKVEGLTTIEASQVKAAMVSKVGGAFIPEKVSEDVKAVYKLGYFGDVVIDKVTSGGGVVLVVRVTEKPPIYGVKIEGAKKISEKKILEVVTIRPMLPVSEAKIIESKDKIRELYAEEGYSRASIHTELVDTAQGQILIFKISENENVKIRAIHFEGNKVFKDRKLKGMLATKKKSILSFLTGSGKLKDELLERDVAFVTYHYLNKGYMRVQVSPPDIEYSEKKKGLVLTFHIQEGDPYKVSEVGVAGDILTSKEEMLRYLKVKPGQFYSQQKIETDMSRFQELYGNQGYAFADIKPLTRVNDEDKTASIEYTISRGNKVFVEQITISGNDVTRDKVIRRELKIKENSLYNESLVRLSKRKLQQLGYFENVEFSTPRGSSDNQLNLNVSVKERPTGTFSVGAGFSSIENFILTASVSKQNFLGLGISGFLSAELSSRRQQFMLNYSNPYFLDSDFMLSINAFKMLSEFDEFRRDSLGGEISFGRRVFDFTSFSLGYRIEDVSLKNFSLTVPELFKRNKDGLTSSGVFTVNHDTRDNALSPTKGDYESFSLEYAGNGLGGDNDFVRLIGNARYYLPLPLKTVLKANVRVGWIKSLNDDPIPLFERFFTGGINSLRGYELRAIGPRVQIPGSATGADEEFVYGGNKLFVFNLEYEFPIYPSAGFRGVVFFDAGNAYSEHEDLNPIKVRTNVGVGFRWVSPFGPLRFEWGFPLNRRPGEDRSVFNFTIGSSF